MGRLFPGRCLIRMSKAISGHLGILRPSLPNWGRGVGDENGVDFRGGVRLVIAWERSLRLEETIEDKNG